jgi:hypothetical protein
MVLCRSRMSCGATAGRGGDEDTGGNRDGEGKNKQ